MKKFDIKDVFSWSNAEQAKAYINKSGYFADNLDDLRECVSNDNFQTLFSVDLDPKTDVDSVFSITETDYKFALFIPADKVIKVEEKKYRPFKSIDEFQKETGLDLLSIVHYRLSPSRSITSKGCGVITEFNTSGSDKTDYITIGDTSFNLNELFNYEYFDKLGKWQPFGVLENES